MKDGSQSQPSPPSAFMGQLGLGEPCPCWRGWGEAGERLGRGWGEAQPGVTRSLVLRLPKEGRKVLRPVLRCRPRAGLGPAQLRRFPVRWVTGQSHRLVTGVTAGLWGRGRPCSQ